MAASLAAAVHGIVRATMDVDLVADIKPDDLIQMQHRTSQSARDAPEHQSYFSSAEDIILAKLEWFLAGGETSERQWRVISGVLDLQSDRLDFEYLQKWAAKLKIKDLLQKVIQEYQAKGNP